MRMAVTTLCSQFGHAARPRFIEFQHSNVHGVVFDKREADSPHADVYGCTSAGVYLCAFADVYAYF
jgi:hypothetical protein